MTGTPGSGGDGGSTRERRISEDDRSPEFEKPPRLIILSVVASTFLVGFGGGIVFPIFPTIGTVLGISPVLVGVILSANRFSRLVSNAPAGAFVDAYGTRRPFVIGLGIQTIATVGYVVALQSSLPGVWFFIARVLHGAGSALVLATSYTIIADVTSPESRGTSMGLIRGGSILGFPTGLVIGGVISELAGNAEAFLFAAGFALIATLLGVASVPETHVTERDNRSLEPLNVDTSLPTVTLGCVNFGIWFGYLGVLLASLVLFLERADISVLGFGPQGTSGIFMGATILVEVVTMTVGGYITDGRRSRVPTLLCSLCLFSAGLAILPWARSAELLIGACLMVGIGSGGTLGPLMALLADFTPSDRMGRASGSINVFSDIGGGLGPVIGLPLIDRIGFTVVYTGSAVVALFGAVCLLAGLYLQTGRLFPATGAITKRAEVDS
ncbi:MFS transporter [Natranaeroarchaeum sulfidigenes]|uniref:MFS family permease n=1 Tax=Natranaeroarchaeum sulfidigenes TaxID=2784880 RepID=A0A897MPC1_9EURY|nr:MFS transporter [Natranaeroarchaeum sulfidigenes]QSG01808.1 MFS family permease [Natranaeroarchaeum sulfidigenes]